MRRALLIVVVLALLVGAAFYFRLAQSPPRPESRPIPAATGEEAIRYPIDAEGIDSTQTESGEEPLPQLRQSDKTVEDILAGIFGAERLRQFFVLENFIQRVVVMIDNLPRPHLPATHLATKPVPGTFQALGGGENLVIDRANSRRYTPYIRLAEEVAPERVVSFYTRFYPLFQEAYRELGYPDGYFNDRLVDVIDHLLATPEVSHPIRLLQPKVAYQFADPQLEALSAGQKIIIRSGAENAARIKTILRRYRQEITAGAERDGQPLPAAGQG